ncbi:DUF572-domain-containing protein [Ceraceosorus guamensis]|uniref:Splicing factor YJU2 n=1 Tax=Ceraceosorus guamensis TaxID=1522189 RepID=A0A316VXU6_9BASI|nr:DUF572-domain-containing protein [Ceraceosorus guamensis]PWN40295.1 DUF572-domain-containing protein [Ceraceosorus guamensis]
MGERKVLNKYFPPEFDPSKIPRRRQAADRQQEVRLMAPFSMRCNTCGEYVYKGKKFNARKEMVMGETYYGIKIFRFYIKCPTCSAEITFRTDPQNTDYKAEHGASRNFEPWRDAQAAENDPDRDPLAHLIEEEDKDEEADTMAALEQRTLDSKREMEIADALQDIRTRNARLDRVNADSVLDSLKGKQRSMDPEAEERKRAEEEDEILVRKYFSRDLAAAESIAKEEQAVSSGSNGDAGTASEDLPGASSTTGSAAKVVKRAHPDEQGEDAEPDYKSLLSKELQAQLQNSKNVMLGSKAVSSSSWGGSGVNGKLANGLSVSAPPNKRKKNTSAFGIVRKKT